MISTRMMLKLDLVEWASFPQPEWNRPGAVPAALLAIASASSDSEARSAYNRLLFATGNNHAGTYYPVVLEVIPFLGEIWLHGELFPRLCTLDALIDLTGSFVPERGHETVRVADGSSASLERELRSAVARLWNEVAPIVRSRATNARESELVEELATQLTELAG
jgi:hypothetical protein